MTVDDRSESKKDLDNGAGIGLAIGSGLGIMIGMLIPSIGIGMDIAFGAVFELIFGGAFAPKRKSKPQIHEVFHIWEIILDIRSSGKSASVITAL